MFLIVYIFKAVESKGDSKTKKSYEREDSYIQKVTVEKAQ